MCELRKAEIEELSEAMRLIEGARAFLKSQGIDQWQGSYPDEDCIRRDMENSRAFFLTDGGEIVGYLCVDFAGEPAYEKIKGAWRDDGPYAVIHRLAMDGAHRGRGLAGAAFALAESLCRERGVHSIRVDTGLENARMQHILKKSGYELCGTIWYEGGARMAFQKNF